MDCQQAATNGRHHNDGDAAEWKQVAELRAVTEAQDPACKVRPSIHPLIIIHASSPLELTIKLALLMGSPLLTWTHDG